MPNSSPELWTRNIARRWSMSVGVCWKKVPKIYHLGLSYCIFTLKVTLKWVQQMETFPMLVYGRTCKHFDGLYIFIRCILCECVYVERTYNNMCVKMPLVIVHFGCSVRLASTNPIDFCSKLPQLHLLLSQHFLLASPGLLQLQVRTAWLTYPYEFPWLQVF